MSNVVLDKALKTVHTKLNELRTTCRGDLTSVIMPDLSSSSSDSSDCELDLEQRTEKFNKKLLIESSDDLLKEEKRKEIDELMKRAATVSRYNEGRREAKKQRKLEKAKTKGKGWFDLPATEITKEIEMDLKLIQMRNVLNPKRFFKGFDTHGTLPKYFRLGTVVDSAADFYSGRIPKKQRKQNLLDELLADEEFKRYKKRKYSELTSPQQKKMKR